MRADAEIKELKGVGEKTAKLFAKVGVYTIGELLTYYPSAYDTYENPVPIENAEIGEVCALRGHLCGSISGKKLRGLTISTCKITDGRAEAALTFFNMPYLKNVIKPGCDYIFRGIPQGKVGKWRLEQPSVYTVEAYEKLLYTRQPRYPLTKGLTNHMLVKTMQQAFAVCDEIQEYLPESLRERYELTDYRSALWGIHFPQDEEMLRKARRRLVFDEFLQFMLQIRRCREAGEKMKNPYTLLETADTARLLEKLPYTLTRAQNEVWKEIRDDLQGEFVMNRLIQGDVGSGKTILAVLALLMVAANGYQGAMMAPTEVLARQHFDSIAEMAKKYSLPFVPVLLVGSMSAKEKRECYQQIEAGTANVIIGTHALIQEKVSYQRLALVITDEQHRFGVRQREALAGKGFHTHVLVMSATPIPRTLAIILYGDLNISVIDELPADRLPIKNCVVGGSYRETAYRFIEKEAAQGRQAYIICPMVEEGEQEGLENVVDYTAKLKERFAGKLQVACLHGRMKPLEKNRIMEAFGRGDIDVLVSTTVIEVGINVPNATVMMVENAERFGLAQLHQLRGRVGRGREQSYCIFISTSDKKQTMERLAILNQSNDGFYIAGEDLKLRGPGDLFGIRQSGSLAFRLADIYQDAKELKEASEAAELYADQLDVLSYLPHVDFRSI